MEELEKITKEIRQLKETSQKNEEENAVLIQGISGYIVSCFYFLLYVYLE
jgi:hypothetical protein